MIKLKTVPSILIGGILVIIVIIISTTIGYSNISFTDTFKILINRIYPLFSIDNLPTNAELTIFYIRLPRILGAALGGIGLTVAGIIFQSILRNPMAEPYVLGVSSGAALGAALSILLSLYFVVPLFALTGALLSSLLVIFISGKSYNTNKIILFGVSINFLFSSILTLLISLNHDQASNILFWTMGSFASLNYKELLIIFICVTLGVILTIFNRRELNLFSLGSSTASSLGLNVKRYRVLLLSMASLLTGIIVSFTGIIGFTGLVIPHLTRLIVGPEHKRLLLFSLPIGAIFMIFCDTVARSLLTNELPVGVVTSLIGAPLFIYLLRRRQQ